MYKNVNGLRNPQKTTSSQYRIAPTDVSRSNPRGRIVQTDSSLSNPRGRIVQTDSSLSNTMGRIVQTDVSWYNSYYICAILKKKATWKMDLKR